MKFTTIIRSYIQHVRPQANEELQWFKNQPSLEAEANPICALDFPLLVAAPALNLSP
jgi:hypothetical protein